MLSHNIPIVCGLLCGLCNLIGYIHGRASAPSRADIIKDYLRARSAKQPRRRGKFASRQPYSIIVSAREASDNHAGQTKENS